MVDWRSIDLNNVIFYLQLISGFLTVGVLIGNERLRTIERHLYDLIVRFVDVNRWIGLVKTLVKKVWLLILSLTSFLYGTVGCVTTFVIVLIAPFSFSFYLIFRRGAILPDLLRSSMTSSYLQGVIKLIISWTNTVELNDYFLLGYLFLGLWVLGIIIIIMSYKFDALGYYKEANIKSHQITYTVILPITPVIVSIIWIVGSAGVIVIPLLVAVILYLLVLVIPTIVYIVVVGIISIFYIPEKITRAYKLESTFKLIIAVTFIITLVLGRVIE